MICPNCNQRITQWENSWGESNARCLLCKKEFNVTIDEHGRPIATLPETQTETKWIGAKDL